MRYPPPASEDQRRREVRHAIQCARAALRRALDWMAPTGTQTDLVRVVLTGAESIDLEKV